MSCSRPRKSRCLPAPQSKQWSFADMVVAAGIFFAATMLFLPAMSQSRFAARVTACQNHLRQVGVGMNNYSMYYNEYFPDVPVEGQPVRCRRDAGATV